MGLINLSRVITGTSSIPVPPANVDTLYNIGGVFYYRDSNGVDTPILSAGPAGATGATGANGAIGATGATGPAGGGATGSFSITRGITQSYYSSLSEAIAAAVSGETIRVLSDFTTSSQVNLKDGVNIEGLGHTYTMNSSSTGAALSDNGVNVTTNILNLNVIRTNAPTTAVGNATLNSTSTSIFLLSGSRFINSNGVAIYVNGTGGRIYNAWAQGTTDGIQTQGIVYSSTGITTNASTTGRGIIITSTGGVFNSVGIATSGGSGLACANGGVGAHNCVGTSVSGPGCGLAGSGTGPYHNCVGRSTSGDGFALATGLFNCTGISTSGFGVTRGGTTGIYNSTLISSSNYAYYTFATAAIEILNSVFESTTNIPMFFNASGALVKNCSIFCRWNNAGGHGIRLGSNVNNSTIVNNYIKVSNATANCISAANLTTNVFYVGNNLEGSTNGVDPTNIVQAASATTDVQGNTIVA